MGGIWGLQREQGVCEGVDGPLGLSRPTTAIPDTKVGHPRLVDLAPKELLQVGIGCTERLVLLRCRPYGACCYHSSEPYGGLDPTRVL